jgi:cysteine-S-conjugate beta-lyase
MPHNFDEIIDRTNTDSFKWDFFQDPEGTIPMPVADMDFRCAEPILQSLRDVTEHGVFGYSIVPEELKNILQERLKRLYGWKTEKEWQVWIPGLVPAITATCRAIGEIGDSVITSIPVYHPFHLAPNYVGKKLLLILKPLKTQLRKTQNYSCYVIRTIPQEQFLLVKN